MNTVNNVTVFYFALVLGLSSFPGAVSATTDDAQPDGRPAEIGAEFSGQWYNPEQSGHGLLLEVLPDGRAFGAWFVFDNAGNPYWLVGIGETAGATMTLEVESLTGGRFPPHFDAANIMRTEWGTLTVDFKGCNQATLAWDSLLPDFGSGAMEVTRLTSIDRLPCGDTEKWLVDLDTMVTTVTSDHPDPFHALPPEAFAVRVAALRERLPRIPPDQRPVAFAELLAGLGDAHTAIFLQGQGLRRFPLELDRVREGLIVTAAHEDYESLLGQRLMAIDGVSVENIENSVGRVIAHENRSWLEAVAPEYMLIPEVLAYLGHIGSTERAMFQFQALGGETVHQEIYSVPPDATLSMHSVFTQQGNRAPLYLARDDNYWYEYIDETRSLYLAYRRAQQINGMPFEAMLGEIEEFIQANPVDRLILDLRLNQGGDSRILQPLVDGLQNSAFNHPGRLFVIIGRNTFSSGLLNAFQLRDMTQATLVCRPTGGKPDHFGEIRALSLEQTGLRYIHSTRRFEVVNDDSIESLEPDVFVEDTPWRDFLQGRDDCISAAGGA